MTVNIETVANQIVEDGLNIYYLPKVKALFEWNTSLGAWVVVPEKRLEEKIEAFVVGLYSDSIADGIHGDIEKVQEAITLFKPTVRTRLIRAVKKLSTREPELLTEGFDVRVENNVHVENVETIVDSSDADDYDTEEPA